MGEFIERSNRKVLMELSDIVADQEATNIERDKKLDTATGDIAEIKKSMNAIHSVISPQVPTHALRHTDADTRPVQGVPVASHHDPRKRNSEQVDMSDKWRERVDQLAAQFGISGAAVIRRMMVQHEWMADLADWNLTEKKVPVSVSRNKSVFKKMA